MANNLVRAVALKSLFESAKAVIDSTITIDQGQHCWFDSSTHLIKPVTAETQSAHYIGVSRVKIVAGKVASPYNTDVVASQAISDVPGPQFGGVFKCTLKTGDSLAPGALVGLDPATGIDGVTATITTNSIGIYQGPAISSAAAGTKVEILVGCQHPNSNIIF